MFKNFMIIVAMVMMYIFASSYDFAKAEALDKEYEQIVSTHDQANMTIKLFKYCFPGIEIPEKAINTSLTPGERVESMESSLEKYIETDMEKFITGMRCVKKFEALADCLE